VSFIDFIEKVGFMKKLVSMVLILFVSTSSIAGEYPNDWSLLGKLTSIGQDLGYGFGVTLPYNPESKSNLSFHFNQNIHSTLVGNSYIDLEYSMFKLIGSRRVYEAKDLTANFGMTLFYMFSKDLLDNSGFIGLRYSAGTEYRYSSNFGIYSDLGWSYPMNNRSKYQGQRFGQGIDVELGFKFYL
jgi:hypothetical protein